MPDRSFLDWPFLDAAHRQLAADLDAWCVAHLGHEAHDEADLDAECRRLLGLLGEGGWLRYCVPSSHGGIHARLDVRSLSLIRETLARHSGLADFVFAMQGLGSGTVTLFGSDAQKAAVLPE
ncbi:MAG: acyl-CoA dehydrogenase family protein, partial [Thermaurantiacus sp.]